MLRNRRLPILIFVMNIVLFFAIDLIFLKNDWIKSIAVNVQEMIGVTLAFVWQFKAYRSFKGRQRIFWLLLSIGMLFYLVSNMLWLYFQLTEHVISFSNSPVILWLVSNIFFLAAGIYKIKGLSSKASENSFIFNIIIFMITVAVINIHYLIKPIIALSNHSLILSFSLMGYPITDISTLFVISILYYLIRYDSRRDLLFIIMGFFLQVLADFSFVYLTTKLDYQPGGISDFMWQMSLVLISIGGYYANEDQHNLKLERKSFIEESEAIFPYISIVLLIVLVSASYHWAYNALSFGLLIIILMILGRHLYILNKNNKLVMEYKFMAYRDPLTGLNNRESFTKDLRALMKRNHNSSLALLLIDLDRFKVVNDTLGHYIGDRILIKSSERLKQSVGGADSIYRLGGDEFVVILPEATKKQCAILAKTIIKNFQSLFVVGGSEIIVTPSIGISIFPENGGNSEDLLKQADAAMYLAKESGKNSFRFYNAALNQNLTRRMKIENELRRAIEKNQLSLFYQPKVDLHSKRIIGMEALLRWQHPELGGISPLEFISIAEETGQIVSLGEWVLKSACKQNKAWQTMGYPPLCISVNVSVRQFQHNHFLTVVKKALQETRLQPQYLELEITESIMQNIKESTDVLHSLRKMGIKTAIDDFGTGYSSLNVLQRLPIDTLKIDKSFIDHIESEKQQSMVKTIIALGLSLNLDVVAEGIEYEYQMRKLIESKCKIGQGYLFSKPVEPQEFERLLMRDYSVEKKCQSDLA